MNDLVQLKQMVPRLAIESLIESATQMEGQEGSKVLLVQMKEQVRGLLPPKNLLVEVLALVKGELWGLLSVEVLALGTGQLWEKKLVEELALVMGEQWGSLSAQVLVSL